MHMLSAYYFIWSSDVIIMFLLLHLMQLLLHLYPLSVLFMT